MKILILGGDGMLGHQLMLSLQSHFNVRATLRQNSAAYQDYPLFQGKNHYFGVDVQSEDNLIRVLSDYKPDALINAVGFIKQRKIANEAIPNIEMNALLPHRLALLCQKWNTRLIHISTDCVFSGKKGNYSEQDISDAEDFYGKSKFLGEVDYPGCVTFRTSFIGLELARKTSLLEWFLKQQGEINGYCNAIYTGITTIEMANVCKHVLLNYPDLRGVWHVASEPISKYELLTRLQVLLKRDDIKIKPDKLFICDRSLQGYAFEKKTAYRIPDWNNMLKELVIQINQREVKYEEQSCSA